jgi:hypothetical protein
MGPKMAPLNEAWSSKATWLRRGRWGCCSSRGAAPRMRLSSSALIVTPRASIVPSSASRFNSASRSCLPACARHLPPVWRRMPLHPSSLHVVQPTPLSPLMPPLGPSWEASRPARRWRSLPRPLRDISVIIRSGEPQVCGLVCPARRAVGQRGAGWRLPRDLAGTLRRNQHIREQREVASRVRVRAGCVRRRTAARRTRGQQLPLEAPLHKISGSTAEAGGKRRWMFLRATGIMRFLSG